MASILWLAAYPKSGNTWLRAFLHNLLVDSREPIDINKMAALTKGDSQAAWYEEDGAPGTWSRAKLAALRPAAQARIAASSPDSVLVKTHNALVEVDGVSMIARELTGGAIYVVRNPLDVAVSYADHLGQSVDAIIELMATTGFETPASASHVPEHHSDWSSHVASWTQVAHPALHVVRYEDMAARPQAAFGAIARFLKIEAPRERVQRAVRFSSFQVLRGQERARGFVERTPAQTRFFRAGKAGGWRRALSPAQVGRMVERHRTQMARFDYIPKRT